MRKAEDDIFNGVEVNNEAPTWRDFLEKIKPLQLNWHAAVSTDVCKDLRLLDMITETGCKSLYIGFESINSKSLANVSKNQNKVNDYERIIREIHNREIMINASLAFGFDHDFSDVFENTLNWLIVNKIETMTSHILTPYPGTKLYTKLEQEGRIIDRDLKNYNTSKVVFQPKNMSPDELLSGYLKISRDAWIYEWNWKTGKTFILWDLTNYEGRQERR